MGPGSTPNLSTTRWDLVRSAAEPGGHAARELLAQLYWYPLYAFARTRGAAPEDAADAVQTFLSRLLEGGGLARLTVEGGRFRSFLRTGLSHQLVSRHRHDSGPRRLPPGGFVFADGLDPETRWSQEPADLRSPERLYDRLCAHSLLNLARERLHAEYAAQGKDELFAHLMSHLDEDLDALPHHLAAPRLGLAPGTVRNEAVRLRRRFQTILREVVASTLTAPDRLDEELRHLLEALGR